MSELPVAVDVLIVNFRTPELTCRAVGSLAGPGVRFWVRDNSGDLRHEDLRAAAGEAPVQLFTAGGNTLYAQGNNELYTLGSAPHVLLLNPDVCLLRQGLETLQTALVSDSQLWATAPFLLNVDGTAQQYYRRFPSLGSILCDRFPPLRRVMRRTWSRHIYADESFERRRPVESPPGACILFRRAVVGPHLFNEKLRLFFSDTDLSKRMAQEGLRADVVPAATASHVRGASLTQARLEDRYVVAALYDRDCLAYARAHIDGWPVVALVVRLRGIAATAHRMIGRWHRRAVALRSAGPA